MPPPTRREQLELDELLSDIYRGIETLPDNKTTTTTAYTLHQQQQGSNKFPSDSIARGSYVTREYELPASSPLVKQHKQELANLRRQQQQQADNYNYGLSPSSRQQQQQQQQPQRSTLKRHTNTSTPDQLQQSHAHEPQSLASFVTSTTPEIKRRVRIVDHPDKLAKSTTYSSDDEEEEPLQQQQQQRPGKVKYVNTNKLIYHQEREPDEEQRSESDIENNQQQASDDEDDEDIDGATRVEYYHTTWLDRQLGRASKRRSSKELNERQVKEKAMIEELKRSLKNGAITLRQSFKGNNKNKHSSNKAKAHETLDDHALNSSSPSSAYAGTKHQNRYKQSSVLSSGLATIPRNHQLKSGKKNFVTERSGSYISAYTPDDRSFSNQTYSSTTTPRQTESATSAPENRTATNFAAAPTTNKHFSDYGSNTSSGQVLHSAPMQNQQQTTPQPASSYSKTLPHNYSQAKRANEHQLLQSHYKGASSLSDKLTQHQNFNTIASSSRQPATTNSQLNNYSSNNYTNNMRNPQYNSSAVNCNLQNNTFRSALKSPSGGGETISSIPSATEVVRSALSRSNSQASINQLNKTINLLPTSPSPFAPSPLTPTQQLKAESPSLTPSPQPTFQRQQNSDLTSGYNQTAQQHYNYGSKTLGFPTSKPQVTLHGTRVIDNRDQPQRQAQQQPQQVYANPHASLMQHRAEQQMRQPGRNNNASIREFNELDSLLRSLSPGSAATTTQIRPGYSSKPAQPAFGFGITPNQQPTQHQQSPRANNSDIYARVQKQPTTNLTDQSKASYLQQHYGTTSSNAGSNQPYTIDVSDKKADEACLQRQKHQELSEFEPPVDLLLPSMEDYQNISRLNPVKNHYWYKPNMSRERAISLLKDKPQGTFIVRDSTSFRGAYGLAVKVAKLPKNVLNNASLRNPTGDPSSELIRHFLIEPTQNGVRLKGYANESVYGSLPALIYQHSLTQLALPCRLVIPRADIEDPNFNQKQKQYYDEFIASKELAKHYPYDRTTTPDGGYRKYPGDVYVHNEHRIIFE